MKSIETSINLFANAQKYIPGGVNSPVRAFKSVGGNPIFMKRAKGAYLYDADGNEYIDYINSWGPMILGHNHPEVIEAITEKLQDAVSFGAPTEEEILLAELVTKLTKTDLIRLTSSGTEACMSALRLARGYTGKNKFVKFAGCYHGHADSFLVNAGSGVATFNIQNVPGVAQNIANDTLVAQFNNLESVKALFEKHPNEIAAIIVEPVAGNMGCIPPNENFLSGLRAICNEHNAVLIFDEVMTGFRLSIGGVQQVSGITADLVTYGKVIGGGMPVGAFAGKAEIMNHISPVGNVYQAGTLSGNPLSVISGYTTLNYLHNNPKVYENIEAKTKILVKEISAALTEKGIAHTTNQIGSMMSVHFGEHQVTDFDTAKNCNIEQFKQFFHHMLKHGVYLPPSAFESWFISNALSEKDINKTIDAVKAF